MMKVCLCIFCLY